MFCSFYIIVASTIERKSQIHLIFSILFLELTRSVITAISLTVKNMYIIFLLLSFYSFLGSDNEVCFDITYEYSITVYNIS